MRTRHLLSILFICLVTIGTNAQKNTNSPYSRFGIGELSHKGFAHNKAMGGLGLAYRSNRQINYLNPASYTAQDTLSFLFDFGMIGNRSAHETRDQSFSSGNINIDHIAISFPISRWLVTSIGVRPYSYVGYDIKEEVLIRGIFQSSVNADLIYQGNGGLNQFYIGAGIQPVKSLSLGFNMNYFFGSIERSKLLTFPFNSKYSRVSDETILEFSDLVFDFGMQYRMNLNENLALTLGGIYQHRTGVGLTKIVNKTVVYPDAQSGVFKDSLLFTPSVLIEGTDMEDIFYLPARYGGGFIMDYRDRFRIGADFYKQNWEPVNSFSETEPLRQTSEFIAGFELTPDPEALRAYYNKINYRLGAYYSTYYLELRNNQLKDYGITFGIGLPFKNSKTSFNFAVELGQRGTTEDNLIRERYANMLFSVTLHDVWFLKRKFD